MFLRKLAVLLCLARLSLQKSTLKSSSYKACVVEYKINENVTENLETYVKIINEAGAEDVDILVFPEDGLTLNKVSVEIPYFGLLKKYPIPALKPSLYDEILVKLSQAARDNEIYVVVNVQELLDCRKPNPGETCPEKRKYYYNTNVVFDRKGAVIERGSKYHTLGEPQRTEETLKRVSMFDTDFGAKFGTIISLDLLFQMPTGELVTKEKLPNLIMPSKWFAVPPFLLAIETQKSFSSGYNVNLLAAGLNDRTVGHAGSGIYSGEAGTLISLIKPINSRYRLLIAEVPKVPGKITKTYPGPLKVNPTLLDVWNPVRDTSLDKFITEPLVEGYQEITLEYQDVTCKVTANLTLGSARQYYRYRIGVFSGVREFDFGNTIGARACAVFTCFSDNIDSCGLKFPKYCDNAMGSFSELTVTGTIPKWKIDPATQTYDSTFFQNSVLASQSSLQPDEVEYEEVTEGEETTYSMTLTNLDAKLYMMGFWGRKFSDDGKEPTPALIENYFAQLKKEEIQPKKNSCASKCKYASK